MYFSVLALAVFAQIHGAAADTLTMRAQKLNAHKDAEVTVTVNGRPIKAKLGAARVDNTDRPMKIFTSFTIGGLAKEVTSTLTDSHGQPKFLPTQEPEERSTFWTTTCGYTTATLPAQGYRLAIWSTDVMHPIYEAMTKYMLE